MKKSMNPFSTLLPMAVLLFFFPSAFPPAAAQPKNASISIGRSLDPVNSTSWQSPSGRFSFGFYPEGAGFRVGIWLEGSPKKTIVWTANRDDPPFSANSSLTLTENGLQVQSDGGNDMPISGQITPGSCSYASMLDSGNFVLYNFNYEREWESFNSPTDTILGGQKLSSDQQLFSSVSGNNHAKGRFRLAMQIDAGLILYPVNATELVTDSYWASGIRTGLYGLVLHLFEDGSMYLVTGSNTTYIVVPAPDASNRTILIHRATLDVDGIFRRYSHNPDGSITRTTVITDKLEGTCNVKGFCGVNSYCELVDRNPNCRCPPGFKFIHPQQWFAGCHRNSSLQDCVDSETMNVTYKMATVENLEWPEIHPYKTFKTERDGCGDDCLKDCFCEAAVYEGGECKKFGLPLIYARKKILGSSTAFFKGGDLLPAVNSTSSVTPHNVTDSVTTPGDDKHPAILIIAIVSAVCLIVLFSFSGFVVYAIRARRHRNIRDDCKLALLDEITVRSYSYSDLIEVTDNFKEELGRGGFGAVYKGSLYSSGRNVAVKRLEKVIEEGEREFRAEMRAIGRTHHKNLVRLLGFCAEGSHRLLVYEYMSNGSLANLLFKSENRPEWKERVGIALDVARGIYYLHEECQPRIIHCDIKPQNILMDEFWTAKISDFGLAKLLMPDQTRTVTVLRGTRGYVAPEWYKNTPVSVKIDVYSFGIVLLEIICCRRHIEKEAPDDEILLSDWVYSCFLSGRLKRLLGEEEVELRVLDRMVKVGLWCIQEEPALRPSMKNAILMLEGNMEIPVPPCLTSTTCSS